MPPEKYWWEVWDREQPYRTKHCSRWEEWVAKYDHHWFWIGAWIGEHNHGRFTVYLAMESFCLLSGALICLDNLSFDDWVEGGIFLVCLAITAVFGGLVFGLLVYHVYLISIGATTWECFKRERISYLKPYPEFFHPFSEGFFKNWAQVICHKYQLRDW